MSDAQPTLQPEKSPKGRVQLPLWVIAALGILALIVTAIIIRNVAGPLSELVFGGEPDIPLPDGAVLEKEEENDGSASKSYLYTTNQTGCEVASFYFNEGARCSTQPGFCNPDGSQMATDSFQTLGSCKFTEDEDVTGYSWEVWIATNYKEGPLTRFRVLVYD